MTNFELEIAVRHAFLDVFKTFLDNAGNDPISLLSLNLAVSFLETFAGVLERNLLVAEIEIETLNMLRPLGQQAHLEIQARLTKTGCCG